MGNGVAGARGRQLSDQVAGGAQCTPRPAGQNLHQDAIEPRNRSLVRRQLRIMLLDEFEKRPYLTARGFLLVLEAAQRFIRGLQLHFNGFLLVHSLLASTIASAAAQPSTPSRSFCEATK